MSAILIEFAAALNAWNGFWVASDLLWMRGYRLLIGFKSSLNQVAQGEFVIGIWA